MAVFTELSTKDCESICTRYELGNFIAHQGIAAGMENSNFFITTDRYKVVLTIFEELAEEDIPFYNRLLTSLKQHDLPVAAPLADRHGQYQFQFNGKPAIVCPKINGSHPVETTVTQCEAIGDFLGQLHVLNNAQTAEHKGIRSFDWFEELIRTSRPLLTAQEQKEVEDCLIQFKRLGQELPVGLIHADLFRDNALFLGDTLTAVLDFYCVSKFYYLFDVAIAINDWCRADGNLHICPTKKETLLQSYNTQRPLDNNEKLNLDFMCKVAAMRFWLSRLLEQQKTTQKTLGVKKAPDEYRALFYYWSER